MKNLFLYISAVFLIAVNASCKKLVDVTNIDPVNQLSEDQAITNLDQAQSVLIGTYGEIRSGLEVLCNYGGMSSLLGLTMKPGIASSTSEASFFANEVDPQDYNVDAVYTKFYKIINNANHVIEKTSLLETSSPRKQQIIGEARFLRALCHFHLLRMFGYFFDVASPYGIVLKTSPVTQAEPEQRAAVQACYDIINEDLDYAIANSASFTTTFYASAEAAKALKAKVLLCEKRYEEAAVLAQQVISSGKFDLEDTFGTIFSKKIANTKEVIFQTPYDDRNQRNNKPFIYRSYYLPSDYYISLMTGDARYNAALILTAGTIRNNKYNGAVYNGASLPADTKYFLRLDEIYLILAESLARSSSDLTNARGALNSIRDRADMPFITANTKDELLEAIRIEKMLELGAECGEEWYDLLRYASEGDLDVANYKPNVTTRERWVVPMPFETVVLSRNVVVQNPGY